MKETDRISILNKLTEGQLKHKQAALQLGISVRQVKRLVKQSKREGISVVMDKNPGKFVNRFILLTLLVYFTIHLANLTLLPIFNDESIYLGWGKNITTPINHIYHLFVSLTDAKQPLMIWIFGIFEYFFTDPLFAGRFASVIVGSITALGIYMVTKKLCNNHAALVATLLYSIIPIFVFYNRQALLEAGVACIGIWSCNALLNVLKKPTALNGVILGAIFGIGFFIKSSSLLFIVSSTLIIFFYLFIKRRWELVKPFVVSLAAFFLVDFILFINPTFWQTFHTNSRYSYTPAELLSFPLISWFMNFLGFFQIGFIFVTPLVFVFSIIGMFFLWKNKVKNNQLFLAYFLFALLLEIFASRGQIQRYLVSFLPFLVIPASYVLSNFWNGNILKKSVVIVSFFIPLVLTLVLIINPQYYISQLAKVSRYSDVGYIQGQTSGYGINEAMQYIQEHSTPSHPSLILTANNIGNPETAVFVYAQKNPQLVVLTITANSFPWIDEYKCMNSEGIIPIVPVFFVTRENQLSGMDRYFSEEKSFVNPDKKYSVRIYTFKKKCSGKTFNLLEQPDYRNNFIDALKTK